MLAGLRVGDRVVTGPADVARWLALPSRFAKRNADERPPVVRCSPFGSRRGRDDKLPKRLRPRTKRALREAMYAPTRADAEKGIGAFVAARAQGGPLVTAGVAPGRFASGAPAPAGVRTPPPPPTGPARPSAGGSAPGYGRLVFDIADTSPNQDQVSAALATPLDHDPMNEYARQEMMR